MTHQVNVRLPEGLLHEAQKLAQSREQRLSQLIRLALREHVSRERGEVPKRVEKNSRHGE